MFYKEERNFRIWRYEVGHKKLNLRSVGARFPQKSIQIELRFRSVARVDLDSEFVINEIEIKDVVDDVSRHKYVKDRPGMRTFVFKHDGRVVGRVDAVFFEEIEYELKEIKSIDKE